MESFNHDIPHLFQQLGLPDSPSEISNFIVNHKLKYDGHRLAEAEFWSPAQAAFLRESILQDSDWAEAIDQLDALLHN